MAPNRNGRRYASAVPAALFLLIGAAALLPGPAAAARAFGGGGGVSSHGRGPFKSHSNVCVCVFDNDRTLTGKQGKGSAQSRGDNSCPADTDYYKIVDHAYGGGQLTLSDLALKMASTWCGQKCYLGILSASTDVTAGDEHRQMALELSSDRGNVMMPTASQLPDWADATTPTLSPFVFKADPKNKSKSVPTIIKYYERQYKIKIPDNEVFFFDDIAENVNAWKNTQYNAHQVSCVSRDTYKSQDLGRCGATASELNALKFKSGCNLCNGAACK